MPLWAIILSLCFAAVPGLLGLVAALWRMGAMHNEMKNIGERIAPLQQMAADIAYLKGIEDGKKQAAVIALTDQFSPARRRATAAATG